MDFLLILVVVAILALSWLWIEFRSIRHKVLIGLLIAFILFSYFSFSTVLKNSNVNLNSLNGIIDSGKIYFAWLGSAFENLKTLTTNAIHMDWGAGNQTSNQSKF